MKRIYLPLTRDEFDHLIEVAESERRRPQDQAALWVSRALRDLPDEAKTETREPVGAGASR